MNVLKRCCYRSLKENPKRTIVTIIGIILATSLITAVACTAMSFRASLVVYEKQQYGDYHYYFENVPAENLKYFQNNQQIEKMSVTTAIGYAPLEGSENPDKPYLYLQALDESVETALSLQLLEGRMPENDSELMVSRHISSNGMVDIQIGDVLTLQIGSRMSEGYALSQTTPYLYEEESFDPSFEKTYTVVGIIARPNTSLERYTAPGYSVFTSMSDKTTAGSVPAYYNIYATYTDWGIRHADQVTAGLLSISEDLYGRYFLLQGSCTEEEMAQAQAAAKSIYRNQRVIRWETMNFSSDTLNMLYTMAGIAITIIILTSVFCIRNSFVISLTEKMKLYGRLSSVGTTSRQQKKIIYYEAMFLGIVGIPLGLLCGIAATFILVKGINALVWSALGFSLVFDTSLSAVLLAAVLSTVTIYFSASKSARMAAKLSPISAIRSNDMVKIRRRELRCPQLISRLFGIGGKVAYKNLKRARVKYRTTVVSIAVSTAVFIGMSTFVSLMFFQMNLSSNQIPYHMSVTLWHNDTEGYEEALQIAGIEGVQKASILRQAYMETDETLLPITKEFEETRDLYQNIHIISIGEDAYTEYCKELGVSPSQAGDKAIVLADYYDQYREGGKIIVEEGTIARFSKGDIIRGAGEADGLEIQVLTQTSKKPSCVENNSFNLITLVVSDKWMDSNQQKLSRLGSISVFLICDDTDRVETAVRSIFSPQKYGISNFYSSYVQERNLLLVVSIFLYGFITVVTLIGVTNIFNTITTNLELRAPEFAMLKSIGMTKKEFRRMIWLEGMFYGGKALLFGIPIGILISLAFHWALTERVVTSYSLPWKAILTAAVAVFLLLYVIMHYSMAKINRRNIIDTIRSENI